MASQSGESTAKEEKGGVTILRSKQPKGHAGLDLVAFGKVEHLCDEQCGKTKLHFVRRGLGEEDVRFEWKTENVNVLAESYSDVQGQVIIKAGQYECTVDLPIDNNDVWNIEAVQLVHMHSPVNCVLGELKTTTVVTLNEDIFPADCTEVGSQFKMVTAFIKHMVAYFPSEAKWGLLLRIYPAISWLVVSLVMLISINVLITDGIKGEDYKLNMYLLGIAFLLNILLGHLTAERFNDLRIGGKAKAHLRTAVLNVNLQLTPEGQEQFTSGDVLNLMGSGIEQSISMVWTNLFQLWQHTLVLVFMTAMMFYTLRNVAWMCIFPIIMIIFDVIVFFFRAPEQITKFKSYMEEEVLWKEAIFEATDLRTCITTYRAGAEVTGLFTETHERSSKANWQQGTNFMRTQWMVKWFHSIIVFVVFVLIIEKVVSGDVKVGSFAVLMGTLFKFDNQVLLIFTSVFQMVNGYTWICMLSYMLNSPTRRKALLEASARRGKLLRKYTEETKMTKEENADFEARINLIGLGFQRGNTMNGDPGFVFGPMSLMIEAGGIMAVTSPQSHGSGKKTFLQMIGRILLPSSGFLHYPDNFRCRFLSDQPTLFNKSVLENLQFGNKKKIAEKEIWKVCDRLKIGHLKKLGEEKVGNGGLKLSSTEQARITLARALLSSVDMLLLANTLDNFDPETTKLAFSLLQEMVDNRGLAYDIAPGVPDDKYTAQVKKGLLLRKPKTVFFVTKDKELEAMADHIIPVFTGSKEEFETFDADGDGILDAGEIEAWEASKKQQKHSVQSMGQIELQVGALTGLSSPGGDTSEDAMLEKLFTEVDTNHSGEIDHNELLSIFEKFVSDKSTISGDSEEHSSIDLTSAMIQTYGSNGVLNLEEFKMMIIKAEMLPLMTARCHD